jgi:hypothetical protein
LESTVQLTFVHCHRSTKNHIQTATGIDCFTTPTVLSIVRIVVKWVEASLHNRRDMTLFRIQN